MSVGYPTNTVIMIVAVMIMTGLAVWFSLSYTLGRLSISAQVKRVWRWGVGIFLFAWLFIRLVLAANPPDGGVMSEELIAAFIVVGLLAGTLPLLFSPVFRQFVRAVPSTWLVGIHAIRAFGFLFLALLDMGRLPAEFALPAGYGDIIVGLLALGMVYLLASRKPYARGLVIGWNLLGLLDFAVALITGTAFIGPLAAQLAASGVSPLYLNYVLIVPTFGVPLFALLHLYSLIQMLSPRKDEIAQGGTAQVPASGTLRQQPSIPS